VVVANEPEKDRRVVVEIIIYGCRNFEEKTVVAYDEENVYFAGRNPMSTITESHKEVDSDGKPKKVS
jgi:hypothetical protein